MSMTEVNHKKLHNLTEEDKNSIIASIVRNKFINRKTHTIDVSIKRYISTLYAKKITKSYDTVQISIKSTHKRTKKTSENYCYLFDDDLEEIDEMNPHVPEALRTDIHHIMIKYINLLYRLVLA